MSIPKLKKERKPLRMGFTRNCTELEAALSQDPPEVPKVRVLMAQLQDKHDRLSSVQEQINNLTLDEEGGAYNDEVVKAEEYRERYLTLKTSVDVLFETVLSQEAERALTGSSAGQQSSIGAVQAPVVVKQAVKWPKLELRKYDGDLMDWLRFWGQFEKIDKDERLSPADKFEYLIQALVPGSKPAIMLEGYSPTADNYPIALKQLNKRFGRHDLLIQAYMRKLLALVIENATKGRICKDLATLYDKLEANLRSLDALGCTKDSYADLLTPLVESSLPDDLLKLWERKRSDFVLSETDEPEVGERKRDSRLDLLMRFLDQEVQGEQSCQVARTGFDSLIPEDTAPSKIVKQQKGKTGKDSNIATASSLHNSSETQKRDSTKQLPLCVFCDKNHPTENCYISKRISLDEKRKMLQTKNHCASCLKKGHNAKNCRTNVRCLVCDGRHLPVLCPQVHPNTSKRTEADSSPSSPPLSSTSMANQAFGEEIMLQTLVVNVEDGRGGSIPARALIDTGSQRSYVGAGLVKRLKLQPSSEVTVVHGLFGGVQTGPVVHPVHKVYLGEIRNRFRCNFDCLEQEKICGDIPSFPRHEYAKQLQESEIYLPDSVPAPKEVELLIGSDVYAALLTGRVKTVRPGLYAVETKLGWTMVGKMPAQRTTASVSQSQLCISLHNVEFDISSLWRLDTLGILDPADSLTREEQDRERLIKFQESVQILTDGRYRVGLPWKDSCPKLPTNYSVARARTEATRRKLQRDGKEEEYAAVFDSWRELGFIEEVPAEDSDKSEVHYLPHRPVYKSESTTTKVRPVFDASARCDKNQPSLNDCMEKGPNLIELVPSIIERFRSKPVGVTADIEKAFLQLEVAPQDRDWLRFFEPGTMQVYRHRRVVFGVSSSPFLLGAVLDLHLSREDEFQETARRIREGMYVDNLVASVEDPGELERLIREAKIIMAKGQFNLRGWESNVSSGHTQVERRIVPILGLEWRLDADSLGCSLDRILQEELRPLTKRKVLSLAHKIFDPIGLLCPVTLFPKTVLRGLWSRKTTWDDDVPPADERDMTRWHSQLPMLEHLSIPRFSGSLEENAQLHVFVDASGTAYAACAFLRRQGSGGEVELTFMRARSRMAPMKEVTMPRLELMACCIGARLASSIKETLQRGDIPTTYWTDSLVALWWVQHPDGPWNVFVGNRVREVKSLTQGSEWRHVPGIMNPADVPSRGCMPQRYLESRWWEGPEWLRGPPEEWPCRDGQSQPEGAQTERKKVLVDQLNTAPSEPDRWYLGYFSGYCRIKRMVAWMLRFVDNVRAEKRRGPLTAAEIDRAERTLFRIVQHENEAAWAKVSRRVLVKDDDGVYRVRTPLVSRDDRESFLVPVLLPGQHPLVRRMIEEQHKLHNHAGTTMLMGILRELFWIVGSRRAVSQVVNDCRRCKRFRSRPLTAPETALPRDRVRDAVPFEISGVDLAGPVYLKQDNRKAWIVLYTCAVYRAVHLELVTSLSAESFVASLRRFIARRGRPKVIYSDNGSNLASTAHAEGQLDWADILERHEVQPIEWRLIPPSAPWWGGWWERLVGILKRLLRVVLGNACLTYEEFYTVLVSCESTVNSRPLCYMSSEEGEPTPLTPQTFLRDLPDGRVPDLDQIDADRLRRRVQHRQQVTKRLNQRFRSEYLGRLGQLHRDRPGGRPVALGEVVLVGDDSTRRSSWPLGRVIAVYPGKDGVIRRVRVRTANSTLLRPIQRIYPLEVREEDEGRVVFEKERHLSVNDDLESSRGVGEVCVAPVVQKESGSSESVVATKSGRRVKKPLKLNSYEL